jgi:hypothetical protein
MTNNKPYRPKGYKRLAKKTAYIGKDGAFHSGAKLFHHSDICGPSRCFCKHSNEEPNAQEPSNS